MKYSAIGLSRVDEIAQWFGVPDHNPDNLSSSPGAHGETIQAAHKRCLLSLNFCIMGTFTYLPTIIKHISTYTHTETVNENLTIKITCQFYKFVNFFQKIKKQGHM